MVESFSVMSALMCGSTYWGVEANKVLFRQDPFTGVFVLCVVAL